MEINGASPRQTLEEHLAKKAKDDLNEDLEFRDKDIQSLKKMVQGEWDLHCPTDDSFLLRFLRAMEFDVGGAFNLVRKYYRNRQKYRKTYEKFKPSALTHIFESNLMTVLLERDPHGRRVFYIKMGEWDPCRSTLAEVYIATQVCLESAIWEEETQISGIIMLVNLKGFGLSQAKHFTPSHLKKYIVFVQDMFPARFMGVHFVHQPYIFNVLYAIAKPFLYERSKNLVVLHGSDTDSLHSQFPAEMLPRDLAGLRPESDTSDFVKSLEQLEDDFVRESEYGYDFRK